MRNVTPEEMDKFKEAWDNIMKQDQWKKLWEEMMDADLTKMSYSTASNSVQLPPIDKDMVDKIKQNYMGTSPIQQIAHASAHPYSSRTFQRGMPNISPTDKDAVGMYEYQEPEQDEQGTFYGYKILHRRRNSYDTYALVSPRYPHEWVDGKLKADREPSEDTMFGIHCTKRPDHHELRNYCGAFHGYAHILDDESWVLVRCALGGTVVETEQGFRAEYAQIVGVYRDGNWTSYQDYSERANARYYPDEEFTWRGDDYRRFRNWTIDPNSGGITGP
jgi:hypothetical protein